MFIKLEGVLLFAAAGSLLGGSFGFPIDSTHSDSHAFDLPEQYQQARYENHDLIKRSAPRQGASEFKLPTAERVTGSTAAQRGTRLTAAQNQPQTATINQLNQLIDRRLQQALPQIWRDGPSSTSRIKAIILQDFIVANKGPETVEALRTYLHANKDNNIFWNAAVRVEAVGESDFRVSIDEQINKKIDAEIHNNLPYSWPDTKVRQDIHDKVLEDFKIDYKGSKSVISLSSYLRSSRGRRTMRDAARGAGQGEIGATIAQLNSVISRAIYDSHPEWRSSTQSVRDVILDEFRAQHQGVPTIEALNSYLKADPRGKIIWNAGIKSGYIIGDPIV